MDDLDRFIEEERKRDPDFYREYEFNGGGVQIDDVAYYVGFLPQRKRVTLYRSEGVVIKSVASFPSKDDASEFLAWLQSLASRSIR